jgi:hypothetical protein
MNELTLLSLRKGVGGELFTIGERQGDALSEIEGGEVKLKRIGDSAKRKGDRKQGC